MEVAIDMHTHVLPGIDDGPVELAGALRLAQRAAADGTTTLVATPHVSPRYRTAANEIAAGVQALNREIEIAAIPIRLLSGAEVAYETLPDLSNDELAQLTLGDSSCLLLEAPLTAVGLEFEAAVDTLLGEGYRLLLAHPERAPSFQREPGRVAALVERGALCSITATSLSGRFGAPVRRFARELVQTDLVHNVASDAHDSVMRPPNLRSTLVSERGRDSLSASQVTWLTRDAPEAILSGVALPPRPVESAGRRLGWRRPR